MASKTPNPKKASPAFIGVASSELSGPGVFVTCPKNTISAAITPVTAPQISGLAG